MKEGRSEKDAPLRSSHVIPIIQIVPPPERATPYGVYRKSHPVQVKKAGSAPAQEMPPTLPWKAKVLLMDTSTAKDEAAFVLREGR